MALIAHNLGFGNGSLYEDTETGVVQYRATQKILPAFSVRIADVTGVSSERRGLMTVLMKIHGQGSVLAEVEVNYGTTELVNAWFKSRIGLGATRTAQDNATSLGNELEKLAALYQSGALSQEEFAAAKRKLFGVSAEPGSVR